MKALIFDNPDEVTRDRLEEALALLPSWRRSKALSFRFHIDRVLSAEAYLLLCRGLAEEYGIHESPEFAYMPGGKPVLAGYPDVHFNLSHCRRGILCVLDSSPVGCDIEGIADGLDTGLCRACFNPDETAGILSADEPCVEFTRLWTMKEAYLKLTGEGLTDDLPALFGGSRSSTSGIPLPPGVGFDTVVDRGKGFVYTVCRHLR